MTSPVRQITFGISAIRGCGILTSTIFCLFLFVSCKWIDEDNDDCNENDGMVEIDAEYDLNAKNAKMPRLSMPIGMKCLVYGDEGYQVWDLEPDGGHIYVPMGIVHDILLYSNGTEYILFEDLQNPFEAYATTRRRSRSSYKGSPFYSDSIPENTYNPPDLLFTGFIEDFERKSLYKDYELDVLMESVVYQYTIIVTFDSGLDYVALSRGALCGMADRAWLASRLPGSQRATVLFDASIDVSFLESDVNTFGAPYPLPKDGYGLNIEVLLKNGRTLQWDFDITDQILEQPHGGIIKVGPVSITQEQGEGSTGAFVVDVNTWGDIQDIDLDLTNESKNTD